MVEVTCPNRVAQSWFVTLRLFVGFTIAPWDQQRCARGRIDGFQQARDRERVARAPDGVPVVGKEDPGGEQEAVLLTTRLDHPCQDLKIVVDQGISGSTVIAGDKAIAIGKHPPPPPRQVGSLPLVSRSRKT